MRVFLMTAPLGRAEPAVYPLGLAYLAAHLAGHDVAGYDANLPGRSLEDGLREAAAFRADCVAFSLRNIDTTQERDPFCYYPHFLAAVERARAELPTATLAVGGSAFSLDGARIMAEAPGLDFGVALEGERTFPAALAAGEDYGRVAGLYYRAGGRVVSTAAPAPVDFAAASAPERYVFPVADYAPEPFAVGVQTRRGCPRRCAYCTYPLLEGRRVRARRSGDVVAELEALGRAGVETFTFVDAVWGAPAAPAKAICREMVRRRLDMKWKAYFDEEHLDAELVDLALAAGAAEFTFSPDAARDDVLAAMDKNIRAADIYRTLALLRDRPAATASYSFFINPPAQTLGSFWDIVKFYVRAKLSLGRRFLGASLGNIRLERGTPVYNRARAVGKVAADANFLPRTRRDLLALFYHHRLSLKLVGKLYIFAWRLKRFLAGGARGR